jgi:thymidylate kinase
MIIIFEGFDNCGKSTIAKALSDKLHIPLMKNDKSNLQLIKNFNFEDSFRYCIPKFFQYYDQRLFRDIIFDRDYMSEYVYGYLKRQEDFVSKSILSTCLQFDLEYFKRNAFIIYCHKTEIKDYQDEETSIELKSQAEERYLDIINRSYNRILMLNTDSQDLKSQLETIMAYIDKHHVLETQSWNIYKDKSTEGRIFFQDSSMEMRSYS